ncbi:MAG: hypothetical protein HeimC2_27220 [Candidatus Heimdallarchaeota archaeon LC_2]|nr:MAG: hypothetical protein HeimC2_27220 [Candidatus Heimdallarchaeota archaeon LC_2]
MTIIICLIEICHRPKDIEGTHDFCNRHEKAYQNIQSHFKEWRVAYGENYRKKKYYQNLLTHEDVSSGKWVKEVVKHLLELEVSQ